MKHVVVTGAGSGIGKAVAAHLLKDGYAVLGGVLSQEEGVQLRCQFGEHFTPLVFDIRNAGELTRAVAQANQLVGNQRITALLNIAGIIVNGPLVDLCPQDFSNLLAVNLVGMHAVTQAFLPLLGSDPGRPGLPGRIINMSSQSGVRTMPFAGAYSASKFGVEALSSAMRMEFRPLGISVAVIAPGLINTPMASKIGSDLQKASSLPVYAEALRRFSAKTAIAAKNGIPIEQVVDTIVRAIEATRPRFRYEIHNNLFRDAVLMRLLPARQRDAIVATTLGLQYREN